MQWPQEGWGSSSTKQVFLEKVIWEQFWRMRSCWLWNQCGGACVLHLGSSTYDGVVWPEAMGAGYETTLKASLQRSSMPGIRNGEMRDLVSSPCCWIIECHCCCFQGSLWADTVLVVLHVLPHATIRITQWGSYCHYPSGIEGCWGNRRVIYLG